MFGESHAEGKVGGITDAAMLREVFRGLRGLPGSAVFFIKVSRGPVEGEVLAESQPEPLESLGVV